KVDLWSIRSYCGRFGGTHRTGTTARLGRASSGTCPEGPAVRFCRRIRRADGSALGVLLRAASEVERHARLVSDDPGVMAGCHGEDVPGAELALRAVPHPDAQPALDDVAPVVRLAQVGARDVLDRL